MQLSRSKLRASLLRPADKSASCLPSRVIAARATRRKRNREEQRTQKRMATTGRKQETPVLQGDEGSRGTSRKGRRKRRNRPAASSTMALACTRLCLLFAESLECGQGGYHVLYRKGVCTRAAVTLLYPSSLSLPFRLPTVSRLRGRAQITVRP